MSETTHIISSEFDFGPFWSNIDTNLHRAQIELYQLSQK